MATRGSRMAPASTLLAILVKSGIVMCVAVDVATGVCVRSGCVKMMAVFIYKIRWGTRKLMEMATQPWYSSTLSERKLLCRSPRHLFLQSHN